MEQCVLLLLLGAVAHLQIHLVVFSLFTVNLRFFVIDCGFQVLHFTKIKAVISKFVNEDSLAVVSALQLNHSHFCSYWSCVWSINNVAIEYSYKTRIIKTIHTYLMVRMIWTRFWNVTLKHQTVGHTCSKPSISNVSYCQIPAGGG